jgi:hypothetical protein
MFTFVAAGAPRRELGEFVFADDCGKKNTVAFKSTVAELIEPTHSDESNGNLH